VAPAMHCEDVMDVVGHLNELRQLDYDAVQAYEQAIQRAEQDVEVLMDLMTFKLDHERHIVELDVVVAALGGAPAELHRDLKGVLLEGMTKLRAVTGTVGALKAMRTIEKLTHPRYDRAMELPAPRDVLLVISKGLDDERRHHAVIDAHIQRLEDAAREAEVRDAPNVPNVRF
jgi:hypothetical protein